MPACRRSLALSTAATIPLLFGGPPASAQMGPLPGVSPSSLNQPNGPAQLDSSGRASALSVVPLGGTAPRSLAALMSDRLNIKSFGAAGNAQRSTIPQTLAVGSNTLTAAIALFAPADVGKTIVVTGAGASGGPLTTTITGYTSGTTVTLAAPGVTLPPTGTTAGNYLLMWGTDDTAALQAAVTAANAKMAAGAYPCLYAPAGSYLLSAPPGSFNQGLPGCVEGDGPVHTAFWLTPGFTGNVFDWSDAWIPTVSGPSARNFRIDGWLGAPAVQNGLVFYDRNDEVTAENIDVWSLPGRAFYAGVEKNVNQAFIRESHNLSHLRFFNSGAPSLPVMELTSQNTSGGTAESTNAIYVAGLRIFGAQGPSLVIRNANTTKAVNTLVFNEVSLEGTNSGTTPADLLTIGDRVMAGIVNTVSMHDLSLGDPYPGYAALRLTAPSGPSGPYDIAVDGSIGGGVPAGKGVVIEAGRNMRFHFANFLTTDTNFTMAANTMVTGNIRLDVDGQEPGMTYAVDPTSAPFLFTPSVHQGVPTAFPPVVANMHDGSNTWGAVPGAGAVDLQQSRYFYTHAATGTNSVVAGGSNNIASGTNTVVAGGSGNNNGGFMATIDGGYQNTITNSYGIVAAGLGNVVTGQASASLAGQYAADRGRTNWIGFASGKFANGGDMQTGSQLLHGIATTAAAVRLTADMAAAGSFNVVNVPNGTHYHTRVSASCRDNTGVGWASWDPLPGDLDRTAATTVSYAGGYSASTAPTRSGGTMTGLALVLAADNTQGGLSVTVTPAAGNTSTIHCGARVDTSEEVQ